MSYFLYKFIFFLIIFNFKDGLIKVMEDNDGLKVDFDLR